VACDVKLPEKLVTYYHKTVRDGTSLGCIIPVTHQPIFEGCKVQGFNVWVPWNILKELISTDDESVIRELSHLFKGIVSRDFVVCFLVSFDRSYISTHQERVLLLLKVRFRIEFFDFCVWAWWAPEGKWRLNSSKYRAHTQEFFLLFICIITEDDVKKNGAKSWACKKSSV
jgi:hypothetical protein